MLIHISFKIIYIQFMLDACHCIWLENPIGIATFIVASKLYKQLNEKYV